MMIRLYEMNLFVQMIELGYILRFENRLERMFFCKIGFWTAINYLLMWISLEN